MRVLWLCNFMPPVLSTKLGRIAGNKEGWVTGMMSTLLSDESITLGLAFPVSKEEHLKGEVEGLYYYGFHEDGLSPENYDATLESELGFICEEFSPDVIHVFGTEYPHTLALLRQKEWCKKTLVHLQGLMIPYADVYEAGLPKDVVERSTFRDFIKKDAIWQQKEKYYQRGKNETEALLLCKSVTGRTEFDKNYVQKVNPSIEYYTLNETLRPTFYGPIWQRENCIPHRIFVSQGNYPIKGAHTAIEAFAKVKEKYPDATLAIAGDKITAYSTWKEKLKISSYGKYLRALIEKYALQDSVIFLGNINGRGMRDQYLQSEIFMQSSVIENSPNSLGEAMILGMPIVTTAVGGVLSLCENGKEVLTCKESDPKDMADKLCKLLENKAAADHLGKEARTRALRTHDPVANYKMLLWIYESVMKG